MRGQVRMRQTGHMLDRVVILLLALAGLAERAAGTPRLIRCLALWPLRQAEAVAAAFVTSLTGAAPCSPGGEDGDGHGSDPADALGLALSLRMLALTLEVVAEEMRLSCLHADPAACVSGERVSLLIQRLAALFVPTGLLFDTS